MPNKVTDWTGKKLNKLEVLKMYDGESVIDVIEYKTRRPLWLCRCECGNFVALNSQYISNGKVVSCGHCYKPDITIEGIVAKLTVGDTFTIVDIDDINVLSAYKWVLDPNGYMWAWDSASRRYIRLHRLILNAPVNAYVDHINGNIRDNRRVNLRIVTPRQNSLNTKSYKNTETGHKGITKQGSAFVVRITDNGKQHYLGRFQSLDEALSVRKAAEIKFFGEYTRIN